MRMSTRPPANLASGRSSFGHLANRPNGESFRSDQHQNQHHLQQQQQHASSCAHSMQSHQQPQHEQEASIYQYAAQSLQQARLPPQRPSGTFSNLSLHNFAGHQHVCGEQARYLTSVQSAAAAAASRQSQDLSQFEVTSEPVLGGANSLDYAATQQQPKQYSSDAFAASCMQSNVAPAPMETSMTTPPPPPSSVYLTQLSPQQWSASPTAAYLETTTTTTTTTTSNSLRDELTGAPPDRAPFAGGPGSPMSTYTPSPGAATSVSALSAPGSPPAIVSAAVGAPAANQPATGFNGSSSSQAGGNRIASPSGASSTISSSDSLANMSINLEQYISKRNERERSRVRNVNDAFDNLKNSLPLEMEKLTKRMSKVEILRTAISYIKDLEDVLGYKQQQQQHHHLNQTRDERNILQQQQQQQQQQHCANNGQSLAGKRPRSGSVGHLMRSNANHRLHLEGRVRALDCENSSSSSFNRRDHRPSFSLIRHDSMQLDPSCNGDGEAPLVPMSKILKRELDAHYADASARLNCNKSAQIVSMAPHQQQQPQQQPQLPQQQHHLHLQQQQTMMMATSQIASNCRQDTFMEQQASMQEFRRHQQQQQPQFQHQALQFCHQGDQELAQSSQQFVGFNEFNANVRCYDERAFDSY